MGKDFPGSNIVGDYILRKKLRETSLSTVWKADHTTTGEAVALKQIVAAKLTSHLRNCLDCELAFLSSVNHPNIIRLLDFFQCQEFIILIMEFCEGGDLASFIRRHGRVQERLAKRFMQQLGAGLQVLKQNHIVHRDLKPEVCPYFKSKDVICLFMYTQANSLSFPHFPAQNILMSGSEYDPVLKIADFGLSRILLPDESAQTVCGSAFYMAPEILQFQRYNSKVDMWSVGAILFELLNGHPPFHGRSSVQLLQNIKESTSLPFTPSILPQLHPDCVDLCSRLLSICPDDRLSFEEFYQHNFLKL